MKQNVIIIYEISLQPQFNSPLLFTLYNTVSLFCFTKSNQFILKQITVHLLYIS